MKKALFSAIAVVTGMTALAIFSFRDEAHKEPDVIVEETINTLENDQPLFESSSPKAISDETTNDLNKSTTLAEGNSDQNKSIESKIMRNNKEVPSTVVTSPWHISNSYINERYQFPPQIHEKVAVNIDADNIYALEIGSKMEIILPDYSKNTAVISDITYNNSSKTMIGSLNNDSSTEMVITSGRRSVHATVVTDFGDYSLQSIDGDGVLYKVPRRSELESIETDIMIP